MNSKVSAAFIKQFREKHNIDTSAYVQPKLQSEQVFAVGYAIRPFRMCSNGFRTHAGCVCFS
ncbi:MAG: hypothetical protein GX228_05680 [Firmicutes bacterium]|jgi:hypothetical protein|nr:hypothetical protein [Bacillota bacterium]NLL88414.1 hypothetical protein [Bacillota bacterium]HKM17965.1 hypothetical protein [Limnochordia bacterium]